ncbi:MAG TPA: GFA family protein [Gemmataceae bacterium]|nr:GFA family protein [Gemmataceae bacterium]
MSTRPVLSLTGGCSCRAIRYEITSFPLLLYSCNCTDCQTASGSAFALNMPVFARDFHILQSTVRRWTCPEVFGEPHQVAVRILREEFSLAALIAANPVPGIVWLLVERPLGATQRAEKRRDAINHHLKTDASSKRVLHIGRLPTPIAFAEHQLQPSSHEISKSSIWAVVSNLEAEQIAPE